MVHDTLSLSESEGPTTVPDSLKVLLVTPLGLSIRGLTVAYDRSSHQDVLGDKPTDLWAPKKWNGFTLLESDSDYLKAWTAAMVDAFPHGINGRDLAFSELDGLFALLADTVLPYPITQFELAVLYNGRAVEHRGLFRLLQGWLGATAQSPSQLGDRLVVSAVDVSILLPDGTPISILEEDAIVRVTNQLAIAAEQKFILRAAEVLASAGVDTYAYYTIKTGMSLAKHALSQAAVLAHADLRRSFANSLTSDDHLHEAFRTGFPRMPQPIMKGEGVGGMQPASGARMQAHSPFTIPSEVSYSALHHRFSRAVTVAYTNTLDASEKSALVKQEGLAGYLEPGVNGAEYSVSASALALVESHESYDGQPFSACADLLYRSGARRQAARLSSLVQHWHRGRIWRSNLAPEMVLHDEVHSQSVDRHVAALAAPLLKAGQLDAADVYHVALAAWLHDWGHASGGNPTLAPIAPASVRDLHGLLTARRILSPILQHHHGLLSELEAGWVAALSAHHQGWTSCDANSPGNDRGAAYYGLAATSFTDTIQTTFPNTPDLNKAQLLRKAQLLLAILRVADGADVGRHRVPHIHTVTGANADLWSATYSQAMNVLRAVEKATSAATPTDYTEAFARVFSEERMERFLQADTTELRDAVMQEIQGAKLIAPKSRAHGATEAELIWEAQFTDVTGYLVHLRQQNDFFASHDRVASVHLVARRSGNSKIQIVPYVRPTRADDTAAAVQVVDGDIKKELGKQAIAAAFVEAGVAFMPAKPFADTSKA